MNPCRLIYRSIHDSQQLTRSDFAKLENRAACNNRRLGLHGVLVYSNGRFLQALEGPSKFVNETFCKIIKDPRHYQVELISFEGIVKPEFVGWSMKLLELLELESVDTSVKELLVSKYPYQDGSFNFTDDALLMTSFLIDIKHALSS